MTEKSSYYPPVQSDVDFVALERDVLRFWKESQVFEASVEQRAAENVDGSSNAYVFYDGPPFANGLPHHGHLLTGFVKDAVARYQTMRGHRVERRFGWDCHGLPAEMEAEKQLGVSGRQAIMNYGVDKFNNYCATSVMKYRDEWEFYVTRQARWVDFENDYKTMDKPYMESVLWAFSELYKKGLIYEGFKVMPYSWAAETVLSSSEIRLDDATREKVDKAVTVAFKLKEVPYFVNLVLNNQYDVTTCKVLAWTTTPWTLPSNLALAVNKDLDYCILPFGNGECWIASKSFIKPYLTADLTIFLYKQLDESRLEDIEYAKYLKTSEATKILDEQVENLLGYWSISGDMLVDLTYEPLFPYFADHPEAFKVLHGDFIEEGSGTGVVHMAPGFGEDDMRVCAENGISVVVPVDGEGKYTDAIYDLTRIETERCILRTPTPEDEAHFIALHTNPSVMETVNDGLMSEAEARADFASVLEHFKAHGYGQWAVFHKDTGTFMGRVGLTYTAQAADMPARPTLRCALLPEFWHGGYGSELCRASLAYGFETLKAKEIASGALANNPRSHVMLERLGMQFVETKQYKRIDGPYYLMTADAWKVACHPERSEGSHTTKKDSSASPQNDSTLTLSLKGLNVIKETKGKSEAEPYSDAQLEKYGLANLRIIQWLKATGNLIKQEDYTHNYPHCWRTDQPIIYKAMSSWFVDVPKIRDRMVELNQQINWIPNHIKDGRFGKWLEGAREWSISRSRFWGCPIPVWRSNNPTSKELYVFGSVAELEAFFGVSVADLHKPAIDQLTKPDPTNPAYTISRVSEVFDCWFESGSMPFAQVHYPFENKEWFEANFPADFIVEYEAQTRGWFYNMMVLSVGLFDAIPFKNCICHGVVLDEKGRKLSKKLKNYVDPKELFETYGSDALRWFMLSSTIMRGNELFLDAEGAFIRDAVRLYIKPLWNAYHFFCLYANADGVKAAYDLTSDNLMDRYILAKLKVCVDGVRSAMDAYDMPAATTCVSAFCEVLNNWYIRRNRSRFWGTEAGADKVAAYNTLYTVLHTMSRVVAPFLPQVSEAMYQGLHGIPHSNLLLGDDEYGSIESIPGLILDNGFIGFGTFKTNFAKEYFKKLRDKQQVGSGEGTPSPTGRELDEGIFSVHLADYPAELEGFAADAHLMQAMDKVQDICNTAHAIRNEVNIRIRQPLATLTVYGVTLPLQQDYFASLIADETNVKEVIFSDGFESVATRKLKIHFPIVGKRLPAKMKDLTAAARNGEWSFTPSAEVSICGETLAHNEFEFTLESTIKTGAAPLAAQDGLVVLDTVLTPALQQEGLARDVVRLVQQSRKEAGFDVADRIHLTIQAEGAIAEAVRAYSDYICEQTLTLSLTVGNAAASPQSATHEIGGDTLTLGMQVVNDHAKAG